jgi:eukaryotic-like serine/threonine-protein kinase
LSDPLDRLRTALADRYRIERELGQGGMATVYLAQDLKHDRKVAIKVLRPELAAVIGADRFLSEIKTTANLQHPHILALHDSGQADSFLFYVMPFVEGESLRDRLHREKQLPIGDAVRIATEVAGALDYAHRHGIIHRDIKPENILLHDGRALVADFGIALAATSAGSRMTETGMSLGTPHYMSPEQAMGDRELTPRSDVYALGAMTYEMLLGEPPFTGPTAQSIVAKVMTEKPAPLLSRRDRIQPHVEHAVLTALEKLPADRFESTAAFAAALGNPAFTVASQTGHSRITPGGSVGRRPSPALLLLTIAALGVGAWGWLRPQAHRADRQLVVSLPLLSRIGFPVLSPAGDRVVFIGDGRLWIRSLADLVSRPLDGTDDAMAPFWSPDGRNLGYFVGNRVFRVPAEGGTPALVTEVDQACPLDTVCGGSWTDDGRILLSSGFSGIHVVADGGGPLRPFLMPGSGEHFHRVQSLPNGRGAIFEVDPDHGENRIEAWDGRERRLLVGAGAMQQYVEPGYLLFRRSGGIWALPLSRGGTAADEDPFLVVDGAFGASASPDGSLLYQVAGTYESQLIWVARDGAMRGEVTTDQGRARRPALSPDETRIAFEGRTGIRIHAPDRGLRMPLGSPDTIQTRPVWAPAGDRIFYVTASGPDGEETRIRMVRAEGGVPVTIADSGFDPGVSADGHYLTYRTGEVEDFDLWFRDLRDPASPPRRFLVGPGSAASLRLSPDGRFAAFVAGDPRTGKYEIYLSRFPSGEDRIQVSAGGVRYYSLVYWSAAGDQLYYVREADGALMAADVMLGDQVRLSAPRVLFTESPSGLSLTEGLSVSRDPSRFLVVLRSVPHGGQAAAIVLLSNWLERVKPRETR